MAERNEHREPATPQEIWEILREVSAMQQETARRMQETDRRQQDTDRQMQDTDQRLQETDQLLTRQARAADRRMDKLEELFNGQWGKLMEFPVGRRPRRAPPAAGHRGAAHGNQPAAELR